MFHSHILQSSILMDSYKLLFYLFFIPLHSLAASNDCPTSYCGLSYTQVRFPFRLSNQQPENCGFPGFDLRCSFPSMLVLNLPNSGEFSVRSIDYRSQTIKLYDPLKCLPTRLLTFNLSGSPFLASYMQNYTLLSCQSDASLLGSRPIECLSNSTVSVFAIDSRFFVTSVTVTGCTVTGHLLVPGDRPFGGGFLSQLDEDISLTWSTPVCKKCEESSGLCGYANNNTQITCFYNNAGPSKPSNIFRIIAFALAIPAMTASIAIACFMCTKDRRNQLTSNRRTTITAVAPETVIPPPSIVGLDQTTIESYTKVVLGESKRLPGHDDAVCPICLSEYHVKETVRCIPECRHCFHAECIDEWLKMNGTCPICRNSPSHHVRVES